MSPARIYHSWPWSEYDFYERERAKVYLPPSLDDLEFPIIIPTTPSSETTEAMLQYIQENYVTLSKFIAPERATYEIGLGTSNKVYSITLNAGDWVLAMKNNNRRFYLFYNSGGVIQSWTNYQTTTSDDIRILSFERVS